MKGLSKFNSPGLRPTVNGSRSQKLSRMILPTRRSYSTQLEVGVRAEGTETVGTPEMDADGRGIEAGD